MQKNRNRSVKTNFEFSKEFLQSLPNLEKVNVNIENSKLTNEKEYFGESVSFQEDETFRNSNLREKRHSSLSYDRDSLTNESDLDIISFGKSSSSSISWCDDYDTEATKRVQYEFERMERILQGQEAIPSHYNKDEYEQWINTFPQLSIIGNGIKDSRNKSISGTLANNFEEVFACHSDMKFTTAYDSPQLKKISYVKSQAIEQVFENISSAVLDKKSSSTIKTKKLEHKSNNPLQSIEYDGFLKISPVLLEECVNGSPYLETRQQSSYSVSRSEKLSSKWMHGDTQNDYSSLPHVLTSAKNKTNKSVVTKKSNGSKYSSNTSAQRSTCVSLPPIKTLSFPSANCYRSSSITPRHQIKPTASATIPLELKTRKSITKSKFEISKCDIQLEKNFRNRRK